MLANKRTNKQAKDSALTDAEIHETQTKEYVYIKVIPK